MRRATHNDSQHKISPPNRLAEAQKPTPFFLVFLLECSGRKAIKNRFHTLTTIIAPQVTIVRY